MFVKPYDMKATGTFLLITLFLLTGACNGDDDDAQPAPTDSSDILFTDPVNSGGCVDFQFYHYSDERRYGLLLSGNSDSLNLTTDWQNFALNERSLSLTLYEFSQPVTNYFCDDVLEANEEPVQEQEAEEGTVRLRIVQSPNEVGIYTLDVLMQDVRVGGLQIDQLERNDVEVGWTPG